MSTSQTLVRKGSAADTGNAGHFASVQRKPSSVDLPDTPSWGSVANIGSGSRTPWGTASYVDHLAPGIVSVGTAGHGGLKLSRERNMAIPAPLRRASGWYEEDCEANIPLHFHAQDTSQDGDPDRLKEMTSHSIKNWFPEKWEAYTGVQLQPGESTTKDRTSWETAHADDWVVSGASRVDGDDSLVNVTARRRGESADFIVTAAEYGTRHEKNELGSDGRFIVDPSRHQKLDPEPEPAREPSTRYTGIDLEGLTARQRDLVAKDLAQRWRRGNGSIETTGDVLRSRGFSHKGVFVENGKRRFFVGEAPYADSKSGPILWVSKATWSAVEAPDERSEAAALHDDLCVAEHHRDSYAGGVEDWKRAHKRVDTLTAKLEAARAREAAAHDQA